MQNYKELKVWQKAHSLVLDTYRTTALFPGTEMYGLTAQARRAGISVAANLADGCGRFSSKDTANFFQISLGSLHETGYYMLLAKDLDYITASVYEQRDKEIREIKAMLISLIKTVRNTQ
jgi:four helix bundle protein